MAALLPSPRRCIEAIHSLLPILAARRYQGFIIDVHTATHEAIAVPTSPEELVQHLKFLQEMEVKMREFDETYEQVPIRNGRVTLASVKHLQNVFVNILYYFLK